MQVQRQTHHHLLEVRTMILSLGVMGDLLAALAFKIDGGRVEEDQVNRAEQIPALFEKFLLDAIFGTAWRLQNRSGWLLLERFAQESHGPVEMVQLERFGARQPIGLAPALRRSVAAHSKK